MKLSVKICRRITNAFGLFIDLIRILKLHKFPAKY